MINDCGLNYRHYDMWESTESEIKYVYYSYPK